MGAVTVAPLFSCSSTVCSRSSCLNRLLRPELLEVDKEGRAEVRGSSVGESGDLEALVEVEGAERRPDLRVSLGDNGGPIAAA